MVASRMPCMLLRKTSWVSASPGPPLRSSGAAREGRPCVLPPQRGAREARRIEALHLRHLHHELLDKLRELLPDPLPVAERLLTGVELPVELVPLILDLDALGPPTRVAIHLEVLDPPADVLLPLAV